MRRIVATILALCLTVGLLPVKAAEYTFAEPVEKHRWKDPEFSTDHAYSIALVGDPQFLNSSDVILGEKKMEQLFGVIADTAEERKLEHVFVLGDITHGGYRNDSNLAAAHNAVPKTAEWENAQKSILQLGEAGVSYSLVRGNHDDYMIDDYFNIPAYTDQFKDCGGFFTDSGAKYVGGREPKNQGQYVYWSATTGYHENSIVNSYKTAEICGNKYIFITVDFNPTMPVVDWLNETLEKYSDHMAIVTTHAYINNQGHHLTYNDGTMIDHGIPATRLWDLCLKLHENVLIVACGHVSSLRPLVSARKGVNGNMVREILVDAQSYDLSTAEDGTVVSGVQNVGTVLYMNFSEDGGKVTFDYYSTLLNKEYTQEHYPMTLYKEKPAYTQGKEVSAEAEKEPAPETSVPAVSTEPQLRGASSGAVVALAVGGGVVLAAAVTVVILAVRKKKK